MALPSAIKISERHKNPFGKPSFNAIHLTAEQQKIYDAILTLRRESKLLHLIYGVTGSGKTELYISLAKKLISENQSVIYCVPEISLSSQIYERLHNIFGDAMVVYHSGLTPQQRLHSWMRFYRGEASIAVGTRSAIFMQCPRLGMIVIDEEHDASYKEHSSPRYNARRVALLRSKAENALVLFGSATPSIESLYAAEKGMFTLHKIEKRYGKAELPEIQIVGLSNFKLKERLISNELKVAIKKTKDQNDQAILLLNRRGFSPIVMCEECRAIETCPNCNISLTLHRSGQLMCHYCGYARPFVETCSTCSEESLRKIGSGTQRMEEIIPAELANIRVFRLDQDSSRKKKTAYDLLEKMREGSIDVLLGTQMVAKGYDFPNVSLVGVLLADIGINLPDFRATERIFALLTQVSGRCGRREKPGRVVVQTLNEGHPLFKFLIRHDYLGFYRYELEIRRELKYPPFTRIARLLVRGKDEEKVSDAAKKLSECVHNHVRQRKLSIDILGPSPAPLSKISNNFRWHLLLKTTEMEHARTIIRDCRNVVQGNDLYLEIDIDPYDLM
jgi:primosomal protein N' (replication factor Y)